ncbi:SIMPL domain-containing protein [Streptobacillus canis]|uniref:SIMPL domain-containing protein n=1 Tax=Streptobacillus canis TaxID=2678686 RepID=UPI0012E17191|nr:SIMPL domain-containing protein [Streptobacillus canis]
MKKIFMLLSLVAGLNLMGQEMMVATKQKVEKEISADTALINFNLSTEGKSLEKTRNSNREKVNEFFLLLNENGIKFDNVTTNSISDRKFSKLVKEKENGYETFMTFSITADVNEGAKIIEELEKNGAIGYKMNKGLITFKLSSIGKDKNDTFKKINKKIQIIKNNIGKDFDFIFSDSYKKMERVDEEFFEVENNFSFKLRDVKKIDKLIEIAAKFDIEIKNNIEYSVSNLKEEYLNMYEDAYVRARNKAKFLVSEGYEIKNVKSIKENKYLVDELERKINVANDVVEYPMPMMAMSKMAVKELSFDEVSNQSLEITIPKVKLENELVIEFIADDGKENVKYSNELNLYSSFSKDIKADIVDLEISINTKSNKDMLDSNSENAKVFNRMKELLSAAGIKYENIETISFDTKKYDDVDVKLGKVIKDEKQATFKIKVGKINTLNYQKFLELTNVDGVRLYTNNDELYLEIKESAKSVKAAYDLANKKYSMLKSDLAKSNIDIVLEEYFNNEILEREEIIEKKTNYITNNRLKISTKDIEKVSLMISVLRELGIETQYINYGLDKLENYQKLFYNELLQDLRKKEDRFNKLENIETKGFKIIKDSENEIYRYYGKDRLVLNKENYEHNLSISNTEIIKRAKENPYKIFVKPYNVRMAIEGVINLK